MEKVEVFRQEISLPGKEKAIRVTHSKWRFTEAEKKEIRRPLRREAPKEEIERFISHLEFFCEGKKFLLEQPPKVVTRATRERVLTDCKAALSHLKRIQRGKMQICQHETLDSFGNAKDIDHVSDFLMVSLQGAWDAIGPLDKFVSILGKYHQAEIKKIGRKSADSDHFIKKLGAIYIEHIRKRPTTYEKGAFFSVVQVILEILALPCADPSKAIKAALKK